VVDKRAFILLTGPLTGIGLRLTQEAVCWVLRYSFGIFLEGIEKGTNGTRQVSPYPDRGSNLGFQYCSQDPALSGIAVLCSEATLIGNLRNSMPGLPSASCCACCLLLLPP
jgi:hypothetical protein